MIKSLSVLKYALIRLPYPILNSGPNLIFKLSKLIFEEPKGNLSLNEFEFNIDSFDIIYKLSFLFHISSGH